MQGICPEKTVIAKVGNRAENEDGTGKNMTKCEETINHFVGKKESNSTLLNMVEVINTKLSLLRLRPAVHAMFTLAVFTLLSITEGH